MSTPYLAQDVAASVLQIVGTFLLAVEAIKLPNLRRFRDTMFGSPRRFLSPSVWVPKDASADDVSAAVDRKTRRVFLLLMAVGFAVQVFLVFLFPGSLTSLTNAVKSALPDSTVAQVLSALISVPLLSGTSLLIGFLLYKAVYLPFHLPFRALELIEQHTASGGIGVLGFVLFLVGACVQIGIKLAG